MPSGHNLFSAEYFDLQFAIETKKATLEVYSWHYQLQNYKGEKFLVRNIWFFGQIDHKTKGCFSCLRFKRISQFVNQKGIAKSFNPISGKVWNDVIRQGRVNLTRKCFKLYKYFKQPQSGHNLFPDIHFDIYLAIESKISHKLSNLFMQLALV